MAFSPWPLAPRPLPLCCQGAASKHSEVSSKIKELEVLNHTRSMEADRDAALDKRDTLTAEVHVLWGTCWTPSQRREHHIRELELF